MQGEREKGNRKGEGSREEDEKRKDRSKGVAQEWRTRTSREGEGGGDRAGRASTLLRALLVLAYLAALKANVKFFRLSSAVRSS